jgi:hypothetical protein
LGTLPPFSVGQGKEFVRYLTEEEEFGAMLNYLNELSPMGHIVPDLLVAASDGAIFAGPVGATPPTASGGEWPNSSPA